MVVIEGAVGGAIVIGLWILNKIWSGGKWIFDKLIELAKVTINITHKIFDKFMDVMPTQAKILIFVFMLLFIANPLVSWFLGLTYFCTTTGDLYQAPNIIDGIGMNIKAIFMNITETSDEWSEINDYINKSASYDVKSPEGIVGITCTGSGNPVLNVWGIEFLNYRYWIALIIIGFFIKLLMYVRRL